MSDIATQAPRGYAPTGKNTGVVKPKGTSRIRAHEGLDTIDIRARKPGPLPGRQELHPPQADDAFRVSTHGV
jgi:hypothetical protein